MHEPTGGLPLCIVSVRQQSVVLNIHENVLCIVTVYRYFVHSITRNGLLTFLLIFARMCTFFLLSTYFQSKISTKNTINYNLPICRQ